MEKKLILWDIDGTLMTCYNDGTKAMNETFRRRTGNPNVIGEIKVGTAMDSVLVEGIMEKFEIPKSEKAAVTEEFAEILTEIVYNNKTRRVLPGVSEILDRLEARDDVFMGLITSNFRVGAEIKLESVGLGGRFDFGGFGDFPGEKWDAALAAIKEVEKREGPFKKENIFIVGDTKYDINCARKTGVRVISVATGWASYEDLEREKPDFLFEELDPETFINIITEQEIK